MSKTTIALNLFVRGGRVHVKLLSKIVLKLVYICSIVYNHGHLLYMSNSTI